MTVNGYDASNNLVITRNTTQSITSKYVSKLSVSASAANVSRVEILFDGDTKTGGTVHIPVFTDAQGNSLDHLSADTLVTTLAYPNESSKAENLTMCVAVYTPVGKLSYVGKDAQTVGAGEDAVFRVKLDLPENSDGSFAAKGWYANVYVWDSDTFAPVTGKFVLK